MLSERELVLQLRSEASAVKQCFAAFSFQALALAATVLALTFAALKTIPFAVYAPLPVIAWLMVVCRIGTFKYSTANRNYGYELHLARTTNYNGPTFWSPEMRQIAWEEALRAWRVVQPTLFRRIYQTPQNSKLANWLNSTLIFAWVTSLWPGFYHLTPKAREVVKQFRKHSTNQVGYPWFMPSVLASYASVTRGETSAVYYAGSYLKAILSVLTIAQYLLLLPLLGLVVDKASPNPALDTWFLVGMLFFIVARDLRIRRRRRILEDEILSIHSCAIVWQAVVLAHYLALAKGGASYLHYTERLAEEAVNVADNVFTIHDWLAQPARHRARARRFWSNAFRSLSRNWLVTNL